MKTYKIIVPSLILGFFLIVSYYIKWFYGLLSFLVSIWFYTIVFYTLSIIWKKWRKKEIIDFKIFLQNFLFSISILLFLIVWIIWWYSYYANTINPASLHQYTLTNWKKTVVFQEMIHIWRKSFYETIKNDIALAKKDDFVYFFEWVKPGSKESHKKFNAALWVKFDVDLYKNFSKLYGVSFQDNAQFLWLVNDKDFNVDISMDEIIAYYDTIKKEDSENEDIIDANQKILASLSSLNQKELQILVYVNQAILNTIIGNKTLLKGLENLNNKELFDVILGKRNELLAKTIVDSPYEKIFVTYGKLHFDGVFELLQKNDNNWKIIQTKKLFPISQKK